MKKSGKCTKQIKGIITITRVPDRENECVEIKLKDESSRLIIALIEIGLETFARIITGLSEQECSMTIHDTYENLGKQKIKKHVSCKKVFDETEQKAIVMADYEKKYKNNEWLINNDGTQSQQHGQEHVYSIYKYER